MKTATTQPTPQAKGYTKFLIIMSTVVAIPALATALAPMFFLPAFASVPGSGAFWFFATLVVLAVALLNLISVVVLLATRKLPGPVVISLVAILAGSVTYIWWIWRIVDAISKI